MKTLILFFLLAGSLVSQSLTWIDLSGNWRITESDDSRFSQPDFDDSAWKTVVLPGMTSIVARVARARRSTTSGSAGPSSCPPGSKSVSSHSTWAS